MYEIFISYRRDGGEIMARMLYDIFDDMKLNSFLDRKGLERQTGPFDTKLYQYIEEADNFVLVLSKGALDRCTDEDDWVRLEIEHALKLGKNIIPFIMEDFKWPENLPESIKKLPIQNGVVASTDYFDASINRLVGRLINIKLSCEYSPAKNARVIERTENTYFTFDDEKEKKRLKIQQNLLKQFDSGAYQKAIDAFEELYILDIGSNNGDFVMDRIGRSEKVRLLVGLEYDNDTVIAANKNYGVDGKIAFYEQNVEDESLESKLTEILEKANVDKFNVINISMVILHLKNPYHLLKVIRPFLAKGGIIIIKDIDDGYNLAYPDPDNEFARAVEICAKNKTAGYRYSGRQIFTLLKRAGYNNICLEEFGLSTIGMDYDERSALFDTYFSFILEDLKESLKNNPDDIEIKNDYEWYRDIYDSLEERFQDDTFYFNLGFVMFTARR